ncbi:hypothetical protein [Bacillus phage FI_KG-Lek]|nr:hypothetical protein [Bacillus phage FI_KG-Lek]
MADGIDLDLLGFDRLVTELDQMGLRERKLKIKLLQLVVNLFVKPLQNERQEAQAPKNDLKVNRGVQGNMVQTR